MIKHICLWNSAAYLYCICLYIRTSSLEVNLHTLDRIDQACLNICVNVFKNRNGTIKIGILFIENDHKKNSNQFCFDVNNQICFY